MEFRRLCQLGIFESTWSKSEDLIYVLKQERIHEFQNQGLEFLGSGNCFDAPSHIPNVSVVRVGNNIHIVSIACWLHYSVCVLGSQNLTKQTPKIFFKRAGGRPVRQSWFRLCEIRTSYFLCIIYGLRRVHLKIFINPTMLVNSCTYIKNVSDWQTICNCIWE